MGHEVRLGGGHAAPGHQAAGRGEQAGERDDQAGPRGQRCRQGDGHGADQHGGPDRLADPQLPVDEGVDVVHDGGQHVAAAGPEPTRDQRHQGVVHLGAALGQQPQRGVVGDDPLGVAQGRAAQAEGPDPDDRHQQVEHRRLLGGPGDQPARGRGQGHARGDRQPAQQGAGARPTPSPTRHTVRRVGSASATASQAPTGRRWSARAEAGRRGRGPEAARVTTWSAASTTPGRWATTTTQERTGAARAGCRAGPPRSPRRGGRSARRGRRTGGRRPRPARARDGPSGRPRARPRPRRARCRGRRGARAPRRRARPGRRPPRGRPPTRRAGRAGGCRRGCPGPATVAAATRRRGRARRPGRGRPGPGRRCGRPRTPGGARPGGWRGASTSRSPTGRRRP